MPSFHFKGKSFLENYHHTVKFHKLTSQKVKSISKSPSLTDNFLIHGDNLKALKALLPTHAGKVKCVFIDPPYNTGNSKWRYNDNVASPMIQEWLGKDVKIDDLTRHDKWCCMMYPRLTLLKELLKDDGAIFISIDDNEVHHLRMMMDEIFGEENFIAQIVWQKKYAASNDSNGLAAMHDYILFYGKSELFSRKLLPRTEKQDQHYKYDDGDGRGLWRVDNMLVKSFSETAVFEIKNPNTGKTYLPPKGKCWRASASTIEQWLEENRIYFGKDGKGAPQLKRYLREVQQGVVPNSWWTHEEVGHNDQAKKEIEEIFSEKNPFDTPKPTKLIKRILEIASSKDDIILDSFAGSGTTAHAVLALNQEDGGNRKFILVECEDYADSITAERIRRVIKGVPNAKDEALQKGFGGSFSYYELGEELEMDKLLEGEGLPSFDELARYAFFTATGENWDESKKDVDAYYIGSSRTFEVFQLYTPDKEKLKKLALNLDFAMKVQEQFPNRQKLIFAPACFMEEYHLKEFGIRFAQLPFEIYRMAE